MMHVNLLCFIEAVVHRFPMLQRWESLCGTSLVSVFGENDMVRSLVDNRYLVLDQK